MRSLVTALALAVPYLPGADWFGFVPLPPQILAGLGVITLFYLVVSEIAKYWFFAHEHHRFLPQRRAAARRPLKTLRHRR